MTETAASPPDWMPRLRELIRERVGLVLAEHQWPDLARAAEEVALRFAYAGPARLAEALPGLPDQAPALEQLLACITVGESFFFRDEAQMNYLEQEWLPARLSHSAARSLRIWSAASSEGQELYSIAMLLREQLPDPAGWHLHLLGTDINVAALQRAIAARYTAWSLRGLSPPRRLHHCEAPAPDGSCRLLPALRSMARFSYLNLAAGAYPSLLGELHAMDLILCRNVFIYLDPARVRQILERMVATLAPGGVLLLGTSDLVDTQVAGLELQTRAGMCLYRKPLDAASAPEPPASRASAPDAPPLSALQRARALANQGRHQEALACCEEALALQPDEAQAHLLQALLHQEADQPEAALQAFRRALYLAPDLALAHYQQGLLMLRLGRREKGLKSLHNALAQLRREPAEKPVTGAEEISSERLASILAKELQIHAADGPL